MPIPKPLGSIRGAWRQALDWTVSPAGIKAWSMALPRLRRLLRRPGPVDIKSVRRLAILRHDGMGDMVLTTGLLRETRRLLPAARITLICRTPWARWMQTCPWVDEVLDVEPTFPRRFNNQRRVLQLLRFARTEVWAREPEVLLNPGTLFWYSHARALAWFTGAPFRAGWEDPAQSERAGGDFLTHCHPFPNSAHEADKCLGLLRALGLDPSGRALDTWWRDEDEALARETLAGICTARQRVVALGLAGSEPSKRWPAARFAELVRRIGATHDVAFVALGGDDVIESCKQIAASTGKRVHVLGSGIPLGATWALISMCDLYAGNDTGFMHMAAAARTPVVAIIGLPPGAPPGTRCDPRHTGPYDTPSRVVRPPTTTPADSPVDASLVGLEEVLDAALGLLAETAGTRPRRFRGALGKAA